MAAIGRGGVRHTEDARAGLLAMIATQVTLMAAPVEGVGAALVVTLWAWRRNRVEARTVLRPIAAFALLGMVIVGSHALFVAADPVAADPAGAAVSSEMRGRAAVQGAALAGRLIAVAAAGVVFTASLGTDAVARALSWYLRPLLGARAGRLGLMARLALRGIGLIGRDARACREALATRGLHARRRPRRYVELLGANTIVRALRRSETQAMALSARGYHDHVPIWRESTGGNSAAARYLPSVDAEARNMRPALPSWIWAWASICLCVVGGLVGTLL